MGSVTAYETNAGKRYRVIYRKPDHIQTQKRGFRTKRDAELFLAKIEIEGANVKAVQRTLGHASAAATLDVYADLFETDLDEISTALDSAIIAARPA